MSETPKGASYVDIPVRMSDDAVSKFNRVAELAGVPVDQAASVCFAIWCLHNLPEPAYIGPDRRRNPDRCGITDWRDVMAMAGCYALVAALAIAVFALFVYGWRPQW